MTQTGTKTMKYSTVQYSTVQYRTYPNATDTEGIKMTKSSHRLDEEVDEDVTEVCSFSLLLASELLLVRDGTTICM